MSVWLRALLFMVVAHGFSLASAQEPPVVDDIRELKLRDWAPKSMLVTKVTDVPKPKFPAIDVHNHLGGGKQTLTPDRVANYLAEMNEAGVRTVVNLDGGWGDQLRETLAALDESHPDRFLTFTLVNFDGIDDAGWSDREAKRLEESFLAGAKGLKFHKSLGLGVRYADGKLMRVDDPKLNAIWDLCAKHHKPIMIHVADPAAFFTPLDRFNERWHELNEHPNWLFYGHDFPPREELLSQLAKVIETHPQTTFICAHFGNNAEDLAQVGRWLDAYPNMSIDLDARISELGRQPYSTRRFLIKYQDRVMFGTDTTPRREAFRIYYRFLETDDEYFDVSASHHLQGFWMVHGVYLPDDVLAKLYHENAERILLGQAPTENVARPELKVAHTADFAVDGADADKHWEGIAWTPLAPRANTDAAMKSEFKMLYSGKGLYVRMRGDDRRVTATLQEDFADLYNEDVFEFFFWPDQSQPIYFEYEISPLGFELPILVPNFGGQFLGWRPWHYEGGRRIQKVVHIESGEAKHGAAIAGWQATMFVPYEILAPLKNVPPAPGATWRANFYRMDYDNPQTHSWDWSRVGDSFHEYEKFGTLIFSPAEER